MTYAKDYLMAQMACGAYKDDNGKFPRQIEGWDAIPRVDNESGFAAVAYRNKTTGEIIVAFRGTDDAKDIQADLDIAGAPTMAPNIPMIPAMGYHVKLSDHWDAQFARGLEFVRDLKQQYPNAAISVTGHSLGGAIAQVSAQAYGLQGVTFDPGGADNVIKSDGFKQSMKNLGLPPNGLGMPSSFNNYVVNDSKVSHLSGDHVGKTTPVSGIANSSPDYHAQKKDLDDAWFPNSLQNLYKAEKLDQLNRHSMNRIEDVFKDAAQTGRLNQIGSLEPTTQPIQLASLEAAPVASNTQDMTFAHKELELQRRELALEQQKIAFASRELDLKSQTLDLKEQQLAAWTRQLYEREQNLNASLAVAGHNLATAGLNPAAPANAQMHAAQQNQTPEALLAQQVQGFSPRDKGIYQNAMELMQKDTVYGLATLNAQEQSNLAMQAVVTGRGFVGNGKLELTQMAMNQEKVFLVFNDMYDREAPLATKNASTAQVAQQLADAQPAGNQHTNNPTRSGPSLG